MAIGQLPVFGVLHICRLVSCPYYYYLLLLLYYYYFSFVSSNF